MDIKTNLRKQFEKTILSRPIIIDNDFDAHLCLAYIYTRLKKDVEVVGIKDRERDRDTFKELGVKGTGLMIESKLPWEKCAFLDFEVHGCPSIGQHMLLKWEDEIMGPNKQFNINGEKDLGHKYPMNTIIYIMYLYDDIEDYSDEQWKLIAIPDKTYQNSWQDKIYPNPEPIICRCNSRTFEDKKVTAVTLHGKTVNTVKVCSRCGEIPYLRGYRSNFQWWEGLMKFPFELWKILDDKPFYDNLYKKYSHIYGKYPDIDKKGTKLLELILKKLKWKLPLMPPKKDYKYYYLIPEYRIVPIVERVPEDVFHHARLDIRNMWVSRKSEIKAKKLK